MVGINPSAWLEQLGLFWNNSNRTTKGASVENCRNMEPDYIVLHQ